VLSALGLASTNSSLPRSGRSCKPRQLRAGPLDSARGVAGDGRLSLRRSQAEADRLGVAWSCSVAIAPIRAQRLVGKTRRRRRPYAPGAVHAYRGYPPCGQTWRPAGAGACPSRGWGHLPIGRRLVTVPAGSLSSVAAVVTAPWTRSEAGQALGRAAGVVGRCVECLRWRPRRGREVLDDLATEQLSGAGSKHRTCTRPAYCFRCSYVKGLMKGELFSARGWVVGGGARCGVRGGA
jgi:hypothetical protein